jgi:hypothetical protein
MLVLDPHILDGNRFCLCPDRQQDGSAVLGDEAFVLRFFGRDGDDRLLLVNLGRDLRLDPVPELLLAPLEGGGLVGSQVERVTGLRRAWTATGGDARGLANPRRIGSRPRPQTGRQRYPEPAARFSQKTQQQRLRMVADRPAGDHRKLRSGPSPTGTPVRSQQDGKRAQNEQPSPQDATNRQERR